MNVRWIVVATLLAATSTLAHAGESGISPATETSAGTGVYHTVVMAPATPDNAAEAPQTSTITVAGGASRAVVANWVGGAAKPHLASR